MAPKKCLPLSVKMKLIDDHKRGLSRKTLMKKYNVKKSSYYRILNESEDVFDVPIKLEPKCELEEGDQGVDMSEHGEKVNNNVHDDNDDSDDDANSDRPQSFNEAVMQWYGSQNVDGQPGRAANIEEAAEKLAQELGFTDFKLNSSGWPLRFRKTQDGAKTSYSDESEDESPEAKDKVLRIQDQITAFQRLQAGESAEQIGNDLGVSKATIISIKKKLKDTLFTPSLDSRYKIKIESAKQKSKGDTTVMEAPAVYIKTEDDGMANSVGESEGGNKQSVLASIERRKQLLRLTNNILPKSERSLSYNEKLEALDQFKSGITIKQIAENFGVSISTIQRVKKFFSKSHQEISLKTYMKLDDKVSVLERLDEGETIAEIAEDLKVNDSTIRSIKKNRIKIMNIYKVSMSSISLPPAAVAQKKTSMKESIKEKIETKLIDWIHDLKKRKIPINSAMILKKALMIKMNIAQEGGSSFGFTPTKDWLSSFKKRHNIHAIAFDDSESAASESEEEVYQKAGPKSKKKLAFSGTFSHYVSREPKELLSLSKFAEGLREMYLDSDLPVDPHRCNSFTPRILLSRQESDLADKYAVAVAVKNEPVSDEETWLTAQSNAYSDSDWEGENGSAPSERDMFRANENARMKRKKAIDEYSRKRKRMFSGGDSDDRSSVDFNRSNFLNVQIKEEPQSSLDTISPNVPMAVLPTGGTYVPPLPMFQMPGGGFSVYMPDSQQMMMQHPINYPHNDSSNLYMNQQQLRGRTIESSESCQFNNIPNEASVEQNMSHENQNMIVMPSDMGLSEQEKSKETLPKPDSNTSDSQAEKARKDRAAAIAESIEISLQSGSSHKKVRELTFRLFELNNKNLLCDERIDNARQEFEKTLASIQEEKKVNDQEIDKVLAAIQEWKETNNKASS